MAKVPFEVAVGFGIQDEEGTYNTTLDAIAAGTWDGDPDNTDEGLVLGDSESGEGGTGLSITMGRNSRDKPQIGSSLTRGLSDLQFLEARTFSFAFPFCGSRRTTTPSTPVDSDFVPIVGIDAILRAAGLVGAIRAGAPVGHTYVPGGNEFMSALVYYNGNRLELRDCRVASLAIDYTPGSIAIATGDIIVGDVKDPAAKGFSAVALPTLDYGTQLSVSAPVTENAAHLWNQTRGWNTHTLTINNNIEIIPDSNKPAGRAIDFTEQDINVEMTPFVDDSASDDEAFELDQALATLIGDLKPISYTIGTPETTGSLPAKAHQVSIPDPELDETGPTELGTRAGNSVSLVARSATANGEFELIFE